MVLHHMLTVAPPAQAPRSRPLLTPSSRCALSLAVATSPRLSRAKTTAPALCAPETVVAADP